MLTPPWTNAPADRPAPAGTRRWSTPAGIGVTRSAHPAGSAETAAFAVASALDHRRGMVLHHPDGTAVAYLDPPLEFVVRADSLTVRALNTRGRLLLAGLRAPLSPTLTVTGTDPDTLTARLSPTDGGFAEEDRTRHVEVFNAVRAVVAALGAPDDDLLGLYGAFGYDLVFHLDPVRPHQVRVPLDRDLVLHLPDELLRLDLNTDTAVLHRYDFQVGTEHTRDRPGATPDAPHRPPVSPPAPRDHPPGGYAGLVDRARELFRSGDLFEVVPSQVFRRPCRAAPSEVFRRLRESNPAPHSLLVNLGEGEFLIGASPEIFVRVTPTGDGLLTVQSSPISGTIARGRDALEDAAQIRRLLNSVKDESELTMCTDVDRNDKSRVCRPGTVQVTARRRIEAYSRLIHTVDTVEGVLRPDRDALDAFTSHLWAVTVTGAPKLAAIEFIEQVERSPRRWYGGAVGRIGFDGSLHTVLTLRTIQLQDGVATVRAGATLLYESVSADEEAETELKASALLAAIDAAHEPGDDRGGAPVGAATAVPRPAAPPPDVADRTTRPASVLLVDHRDSFVHTLADYCRQAGATVSTYRAGAHLPALRRDPPDLLLLSPGPGRPADFDVVATVTEALLLGVPVFGVCLGLQAIVEYVGGKLHVLEHPVHGKPSTVRVAGDGGRLLAGLPASFEVGRYHSLYARHDEVPDDLVVTARTDDGVVMAAQHRRLPLAGVQFHPESVMTAAGRAGHVVLDNVMAWARRAARPLDRELSPSSDGS